MQPWNLAHCKKYSISGFLLLLCALFSAEVFASACPTKFRIEGEKVTYIEYTANMVVFPGTSHALFTSDRCKAVKDASDCDDAVNKAAQCMKYDVPGFARGFTERLASAFDDAKAAGIIGIANLYTLSSHLSESYKTSLSVWADRILLTGSPADINESFRIQAPVVMLSAISYAKEVIALFQSEVGGSDVRARAKSLFDTKVSTRAAAIRNFNTMCTNNGGGEAFINACKQLMNDPRYGGPVNGESTFKAAIDALPTLSNPNNISSEETATVQYNELLDLARELGKAKLLFNAIDTSTQNINTLKSSLAGEIAAAASAASSRFASLESELTAMESKYDQRETEYREISDSLATRPCDSAVDPDACRSTQHDKVAIYNDVLDMRLYDPPQRGGCIKNIGTSVCQNYKLAKQRLVSMRNSPLFTRGCPSYGLSVTKATCEADRAALESEFDGFKNAFNTASNNAYNQYRSIKTFFASISAAAEKKRRYDALKAKVDSADLSYRVIQERLKTVSLETYHDFCYGSHDSCPHQRQVLYEQAANLLGDYVTPDKVASEPEVPPQAEKPSACYPFVDPCPIKVPGTVGSNSTLCTLVHAMKSQLAMLNEDGTPKCTNTRLDSGEHYITHLSTLAKSKRGDLDEKLAEMNEKGHGAVRRKVTTEAYDKLKGYYDGLIDSFAEVSDLPHYGCAYKSDAEKPSCTTAMTRRFDDIKAQLGVDLSKTDRTTAKNVTFSCLSATPSVTSLCQHVAALRQFKLWCDAGDFRCDAEVVNSVNKKVTDGEVVNRTLRVISTELSALADEARTLSADLESSALVQRKSAIKPIEDALPGIMDPVLAFREPILNSFGDDLCGREVSDDSKTLCRTRLETYRSRFSAKLSEMETKAAAISEGADYIRTHSCAEKYKIPTEFKACRDRQSEALEQAKRDKDALASLGTEVTSLANAVLDAHGRWKVDSAAILDEALARDASTTAAWVKAESAVEKAALLSARRGARTEAAAHHGRMFALEELPKATIGAGEPAPITLPVGRVDGGLEVTSIGTANLGIDTEPPSFTTPSEPIVREETSAARSARIINAVSSSKATAGAEAANAVRLIAADRDTVKDWQTIYCVPDLMIAEDKVEAATKCQAEFQVYLNELEKEVAAAKAAQTKVQTAVSAIPSAEATTGSSTVAVSGWHHIEAEQRALDTHVVTAEAYRKYAEELKTTYKEIHLEAAASTAEKAAAEEAAAAKKSAAEAHAARIEAAKARHEIPAVRRFDIHNCTSSGQYAESTWCGYLEPSFHLQGGNSDVMQFGMGAALARRDGRWEYGFAADSNYVSSQGQVSDDNYWAGFKLRYQYSDDNSIYDELSYETKVLQGYRYIVGNILGIEHMTRFNDAVVLQLAAGLGVRASETTAAINYTDFTQDLRAQLGWTINEDTALDQLLTADIGNFGDALTTLNSVTTLSTRVSDAVSFVMTFEANHKSIVPRGTRRLTSSGKVGLRYDF